MPRGSSNLSLHEQGEGAAQFNDLDRASALSSELTHPSPPQTATLAFAFFLSTVAHFD